MSRTHLINGSSAAFIVEPVHTMRAASERAATGSDIAFNPVIKSKPFSFDLVERIRGITSQTMRERLLSSLAFSADGYINGHLARLLGEFYKTPQDQDAPAWSTYQEFLHFAQSLEHSDNVLDSMGIDAPNEMDTLRRLYAIRMECHRLLADGKMGYETPSLEDFIANPRLRSVDSDTYVKWEGLAEDEAEGDVELKDELLAVYKEKAKGENLASLEWDKKRAKVLVLMLQAFKLTDMEHSLEDPEAEPFLKLNASQQYKMLQGARRSLDKFMLQSARDPKVPSLEYAKLRVERKPYVKDLDDAMAHDRFDTIRT